MRRSAPIALLTLLGIAALVDAACLGCSRGRETRSALPNIVLVIADDQSFRDFGFMGSERALTPHLDRLADEGIVFTHGFNSASSCRPSLRTLLTGLQPIQIEQLEDSLREGGRRWPEIASIMQLDTLPRRLFENGYVSFEGGKYWEAGFTHAGFTHGMTEDVMPEAPDKTNILRQISGGAGLDLGRTTMQPLYDFIDEHSERPFFVWFAPMLPHTPHDPPPHNRDLYPRGRFSRAERLYLGNVSRLDDRVGELLAHLDERGLRESTVIVFLSDNGWDPVPKGPQYIRAFGGPKGKFSIHENGFRTPVVFSWPGVLTPGRRHAELVSTADLFPTILEIGGVTEPSPLREGSSLLPFLLGTGPFERTVVHGAVSRLRRAAPGKAKPGDLPIKDERAYFRRDREWRYLWRAARGEEELYAIERDPWEEEDLAGSHPELIEAFRADVEQWLKAMTAVHPTR
jgi:arylsulfatase A-like enzyme